MAMGFLQRRKTLLWRVRVSKRGWSMAMGLLKRKKTLVGRVRVSKRGWSMARGPWSKTLSWEAQVVQVGMVDGQEALERRFWLRWSGCISGGGRWPWGP